MEFPQWVSEPKNQTPQEAAHKRLCFIIRRAGLLLVDGSGSIEPIAARCGMACNTMNSSMKRGRFTASAALKIERAFGSDIAPHALLMDPLGERAVGKDTKH